MPGNRTQLKQQLPSFASATFIPYAEALTCCQHSFRKPSRFPIYYPPSFSFAPESIPPSTRDLTQPFLNKREIKNVTPQQITADSSQWIGENEDEVTISQEQEERNHCSAILKKTQMPTKQQSEAVTTFLAWPQLQVTEWPSITARSTWGLAETLKFLLLKTGGTILSSWPGRGWWGTEGWVWGNRGQKHHAESEAHCCRTWEPTQPLNFCKGLAHNLIRAKEIAKVAFERHSMVRSWRPWAWQLAAYMRPRSTDGRQLAQVPGCQLD